MSEKVYFGELGRWENSPNEFDEPIPTHEDELATAAPSRRDFLKAMGFSLAAASLAACEAPVRKAIPYLNKPVDLEPGIPNYYATTYIQGSDCYGLIVKTREGRPIKLSANPASLINSQGLSAQVEASILGLYDTARYKTPQYQGSPHHLGCVG